MDGPYGLAPRSRRRASVQVFRSGPSQRNDLRACGENPDGRRRLSEVAVSCCSYRWCALTRNSCTSLHGQKEPPPERDTVRPCPPCPNCPTADAEPPVGPEPAFGGLLLLGIRRFTAVAAGRAPRYAKMRAAKKKPRPMLGRVKLTMTQDKTVMVTSRMRNSPSRPHIAAHRSRSCSTSSTAYAQEARPKYGTLEVTTQTWRTARSSIDGRPGNGTDLDERAPESNWNPGHHSVEILFAQRAVRWSGANLKLNSRSRRLWSLNVNYTPKKSTRRHVLRAPIR
jgi:hypothetical protein